MKNLIEKTNNNKRFKYLNDEIYIEENIDDEYTEKQNEILKNKAKYFLSLINDDEEYIINDLWEALYAFNALQFGCVDNKKIKSKLSKTISLYLNKSDIIQEIHNLKTNYPNSIYEINKVNEILKYRKDKFSDDDIFNNYELFNFDCKHLSNEYIESEIHNIILCHKFNNLCLHSLLEAFIEGRIFKTNDNNIIDNIIDIYIKTDKYGFNLLTKLKNNKYLQSETKLLITNTLNDSGKIHELTTELKLSDINILSYVELHDKLKPIVTNGKISIINDNLKSTIPLNNDYYLNNHMPLMYNFFIQSTYLEHLVKCFEKQDYNIIEYLNYTIDITLNKHGNLGFFTIDGAEDVMNDSIISKNRFLAVQIEMLLKQWDCLQNNEIIKREYFKINSQTEFVEKLTLLSADEQEFFDFILNNKGFKDNFALRNYYMHSGFSIYSNHEQNYYYLLLLLIMTIYKIEYKLTNKI